MLKSLSDDIEVMPRSFAFSEDKLLHLVEAGIDFTESNVDLIEARIDLSESSVNSIEPSLNFVVFHGVFTATVVPVGSARNYGHSC